MKSSYTAAYAEPRLPFGPLAEAAARHLRPRTADDGAVIHGSILLAEACGVGHGTVRQWARRGMTWDTADKAACALGLHPASVWDDWFERVPDEEAAA